MTDKTADTTFPLRLWLGLTAFMVFAMAVIGAITRLTESGLSMVEWRPLVGTIPPLTADEWMRVFDLYRQTPEYRHVNSGMSLEEFKYIFFWEWFHRVWGRLIGLVYAVPLIVFWIRGMIPQKLKPELAALLGLGALQAVIGYVMVRSGLVDRPSVSHFRLALHLSVAFVIFGWLMMLVYRLSPEFARRDSTFCQRRHGYAALGLLSVTIIWGAFVAGLDAGLVYNEWPMMGEGGFIPSDMWFLSPAWINLIENPAAIQFTHRWIAIVAFIAIVTFAWRVRGCALGLMAFAQIGLGVATLLTQVWIPLAAAHQAGAFILLALLLRDQYRLKPA